MKNFIEDMEEFYEAVSYMSTRTETGNRQPLVPNFPYQNVEGISTKIAKELKNNLSLSNFNLILPTKIGQ